MTSTIGRPRIEFVASQQNTRETLARTVREMHRIDGELSTERQRLRDAQERIAVIEADIRMDVVMDRSSYPNDAARSAAVQQRIYAAAGISDYRRALAVVETSIARLTADHDALRRERQNALALLAHETAYMQQVAADREDATR